MRKVGNTPKGEDSNPIITAETTHGNNSLIQADTYDITYHAKQWGKGLLVFGAGLLGYVGFTAVFGSRREANTPETERVIDGNLVFPEKNHLNIQVTIGGISTSQEHQGPKEFIPTVFSTSRTLLSVIDSEDKKNDVELNYRSIKIAEKSQFMKSQPRRSLPDGYRGSSKFWVNSSTSSQDFFRLTDVMHLTEGGFIVGWEIFNRAPGDSQGVSGQRYDVAGQPIGLRFQVNTYTASSSQYPAVTRLNEGGFVAVWQRSDQNRKNLGIYGQLYDAAGKSVGFEFRVTNTSSYIPAVTHLTKGGFVVVWTNYQDGGIYGQLYNNTTQPVGPEFQVNNINWSQAFVTSLIDGGFVVVWIGKGVHGQLYNKIGQQVGSEFQVNATMPTFFGHQAVARLFEGGCVVVWKSLKDGDIAVYGQRYNAIGQALGSEFRVNTYTISFQSSLSVMSLTEGGFMVVWSVLQGVKKLDGVYGQRYDTKGFPKGNKFRVGYSNSNTWAVTHLSEGGFVVVWEEYDGPNNNIYGRIFTPHASPVLLKNELMITQGGMTQITPTMLLAMHHETNNATLRFTIRNITFGRFEYLNTPGSAITTFIQQDIMVDQIRFVHDGSTNKPYYEIKVSDGVLETAFVLPNVTFSLQNLWNDPLTTFLVIGSIVSGICICLTGSALVLIIPTALLLVKNKKNNHKSSYYIKLETLDGTVTLSPFMKRFNVDPNEIRLIEKIGQGGQASVYRAKWSKKTVAYKMTPIVDVNAISEFEKEAKIMLESNHPNIVHVFRICVTPKRIGLVMEFMALGSLKEVIKKKSILLTWETKWNIAYDLATVVAFLHEKDVVHRDIKTDNLLLYQDDGEIHAKLADFGLSKGNHSREATAVTMGIGTYKYMAPEMMLGDGHYSEKATDVYAIGMTFVALINEEEPYAKMRNAMHIPAAVARGEYWQKLAKEKCTPLFFKLTNLCRSIDPNERPAAKEIVKQLKEMEDAVMDFEEIEDFSQEQPSPSVLMDRPSNEKLPIKSAVASINQVIPFSIEQTEKNKPLDDLIGALKGEIEKVQNEKFDVTDLEAIESKLQKIRLFMGLIRNSMAQQKEKEKILNPSNLNPAVPGKPIHQAKHLAHFN